MQKTGRLNRNGIPILKNSEDYNESRRAIGQNLAYTATLVERAVRAGVSDLTPKFTPRKKGGR